MLANRTVFCCLLSTSFLVMQTTVATSQEKNVVNLMDAVEKDFFNVCEDYTNHLDEMKKGLGTGYSSCADFFSAKNRKADCY